MLDARLSHAFDVHLAKVPRVVLTRPATLLAVFVFAYFVRHWGAWTFFGMSTTTGPGRPVVAISNASSSVAASSDGSRTR